METNQKRRCILVTGAVGQIGSELVPALRLRYGSDSVVAAGHKKEPPAELKEGPFERVDATKKEQIIEVVKKYSITDIYHLASLLSATSELDPQLAWSVNLESLRNVLEVAREYQLRVFWPSSIGVFGPNTPKINTPQHTILEPTSIYGVTKVAGELLCNYYCLRCGVDVRSIRFPGIISWKTEPGGGTTDYAVGIFFEAVQKGKYVCYLSESMTLPMMYMDDAVNAIISLMSANRDRLTVHTSYNLTAFSVNPKSLVVLIQKRFPHFVCHYQVDPLRENIAASWPDSIDDRTARNDWDWCPTVDLEKMVDIMLEKITEKLSCPPN